jgi:hypothetical protein
MRKLKLDLDSLEVESFAPSEASEPTGTVQGRFDQDPGSTDCDDGTGGWFSLFGTCNGCPTQGTCIGPTYCCQPTWRPTCPFTCPFSCYPPEECGY